MNVNTHELRDLGWKPFLQQQVTEAETERLWVVRVSAHLRSQIVCLHGEDEVTVPISLTSGCGELAVGDWLLLAPDTLRVVRRLERYSVVSRKAPGRRAQTQLIAANLDTLFIVSSCDHDFNPSRLERYLSLAAEAEICPVVVLTKADLCDDPQRLQRQASKLKSGLLVELIDARSPTQAEVLASWCGVGQTVALVGSSGVGKSTLAMSLGAPVLATQPVREDDSKGRHTTTARWIHRLDAGGLLIDTPGMRELQLADCASGLNEVFDDIIQLANACRFNDCSHHSEPGCAVQAAVESGDLEERRFASYMKISAEQAHNAKTLQQRRMESRQQGRLYKSILSDKKKRRSGD